MSPFDLLHANQRFIQSLQKSFADILAKVGQANGVTLEAKPPVEEASTGQVTETIVALRTANSSASAIYPIGLGDATQVALFQELFGKKTLQPKEKPTEHDLAMAIYRGLEEELKGRGETVDPKRSMVLTGAMLGGWQKAESEQVLRFPFTTPKGELSLRIPLLTSELMRQKNMEFYGWREDTRILVVDDSSTSRMSSRQHLAMAGFFNVDECIDGQSAYTKVAGSRPPFGMVVADWHMPNMSGIELLKKIRATEDVKSIPVILATGERKKEEIMNAIKEGVTGYLVKPLAPESFFKSIKQAAEAAKKAK